MFAPSPTLIEVAVSVMLPEAPVEASAQWLPPLATCRLEIVVPSAMVMLPVAWMVMFLRPRPPTNPSRMTSPMTVSSSESSAPSSLPTMPTKCWSQEIALPEREVALPGWIFDTTPVQRHLEIAGVVDNRVGPAIGDLRGGLWILLLQGDDLPRRPRRHRLHGERRVQAARDIRAIRVLEQEAIEVQEPLAGGRRQERAGRVEQRHVGEPRRVVDRRSLEDRVQAIRERVPEVAGARERVGQGGLLGCRQSTPEV